MEGFKKERQELQKKQSKDIENHYRNFLSDSIEEEINRQIIVEKAKKDFAKQFKILYGISTNKGLFCKVLSDFKGLSE